MRAIIAAFLLVAALATDVSACRYCGRYGSSCYYYVAPKYTPPVYNYSYPYTDQRFQVSYTIYNPAPTAAGSTQFAYQQQQFPYMDSTIWMNSAARYAQLSAENASRGNSEMLQTASYIFGQQAAVAQSQSQALSLESLAVIAKNTQALPVGGTVTLGVEATRGADGAIKMRAISPGHGVVANGSVNPLTVPSIVEKKCVQCHGGGRLGGGLDLTDLSKLTKEQGEKMLDRITRGDDKRMPQGGSLTAPEIATFFSAFYQAQAEAEKQTEKQTEKQPPQKESGDVERPPPAEPKRPTPADPKPPPQPKGEDALPQEKQSRRIPAGPFATIVKGR